MKIQILGTGCPKCKSLEANVKIAIEESGINAKIEKVSDIDKIIDFGVMSTPAIVIDGTVKSYGKLNTVEEIKGWLK